MSISALNDNVVNQNATTSCQFRSSQFRLLGKDLTSGNLSAVQSDFATLQQALAQIPAVSSPESSDPAAQAFQQLSHDVKSGNLAAAKQDYLTIEQQLAERSRLNSFHHQHPFVGGPERNKWLSGSVGGLEETYSALMPALGGGSAQVNSAAGVSIVA